MSLAKFLFELASLKNIPRSGWLKLNIKFPESVAEHSFLTGIIAFFIGLKEFKDVNEASKVAVAALLHDCHEARTLDLHKLAKKYVEVDEEKAIEEQLDFDEGRILRDLMRDYGKIVRDADRIELYIQSRIYADICKDAQIYGEKIELETESGKEILEQLKNTDHRWWLEFEIHSR